MTYRSRACVSSPTGCPLSCSSPVRLVVFFELGGFLVGFSLLLWVCFEKVYEHGFLFSFLVGFIFRLPDSGTVSQPDTGVRG